MKFLRILLVLASACGLTRVIEGQQACKAEVAVSVINGNGESYRGLAAEDFLARADRGTVNVKSVTFDDGPRRILLVVDTSPKLPANTHKAEVELVKTLLAAKRPQDSLAFMPAHGPGQVVKFDDDSSKIVEAMEGTGTAGKDRGVLDAVMDAIEWFSDPHPGDSIVLIAPSTGGNHKTNPKALATSLSSHHVRLFGLALGPVMTRNLTKEGVATSTVSQGLAYTQTGVGTMVYDTGDEDFYPLTTNSGGVVITAIRPQSETGSDHMDDPRVVQFVKSRAQILGNAVHALYRVEIDRQTSRPQGWSLEIREDIRKSSPSMFILYGHELGPC